VSDLEFLRCPNFAGAVSDGYIFTVNADGIELSSVSIEQLTDNTGTCQIKSSAKAGPTQSGDNGTFFATSYWDRPNMTLRSQYEPRSQLRWCVKVGESQYEYDFISIYIYIYI